MESDILKGAFFRMTSLMQIDEYMPNGRIKSRIKKYSEEYRVLASLRYYDHECFNQWKHSDAPDLQNQDGSDGIEITTIGEKASDFQYHIITEEMKKTRICGNKVHKAYNLIKNQGKDINYITADGILLPALTDSNNSERLILEISKAIELKNEKIEDYKKKCQTVGLAIIVDLNTINENDLKSTLEKPNNVFIESQFDILYLLTWSELIIIDIQEKNITEKRIPKEVNCRIKKLSRMTAEGCIDNNDPIWKNIHHF